MEQQTGTRRKKLRLGDILVQQNVLSEEKLQAALKKQRGSGKKLGEGKITFGVFALATVKGNSIIAYDESAKKLYRIDF